MDDGGSHKSNKILVKIYVPVIRVWNHSISYINSLMQYRLLSDSLYVLSSFLIIIREIYN